MAMAPATASTLVAIQMIDGYGSGSIDDGGFGYVDDSLDGLGFSSGHAYGWCLCGSGLSSGYIDANDDGDIGYGHSFSIGYGWGGGLGSGCGLRPD